MSCVQKHDSGKWFVWKFKCVRWGKRPEKWSRHECRTYMSWADWYESNIYFKSNLHPVNADLDYSKTLNPGCNFEGLRIFDFLGYRLNSIWKTICECHFGFIVHVPGLFRTWDFEWVGMRAQNIYIKRDFLRLPKCGNSIPFDFWDQRFVHVRRF